MSAAPPPGEGERRPAVLRITQHPFPADSIVRRDVLELARRGFEVDVACPGDPRFEAVPSTSGRGEPAASR
jgi:hypothetical protein